MHCTWNQKQKLCTFHHYSQHQLGWLFSYLNKQSTPDGIFFIFLVISMQRLMIIRRSVVAALVFILFFLEFLYILLTLVMSIVTSYVDSLLCIDHSPRCVFTWAPHLYADHLPPVRRWWFHHSYYKIAHVLVFDTPPFHHFIYFLVVVSACCSWCFFNVYLFDISFYLFALFVLLSWANSFFFFIFF